MKNFKNAYHWSQVNFSCSLRNITTFFIILWITTLIVLIIFFFVFKFVIFHWECWLSLAYYYCLLHIVYFTIIRVTCGIIIESFYQCLDEIEGQNSVKYGIVDLVQIIFSVNCMQFMILCNIINSLGII